MRRGIRRRAFDAWCRLIFDSDQELTSTKKELVLKDRLERVKERIKIAAEACRRPSGTVRLIAVSKTVPAKVVQEAIAAGVTDLGENYIQEARDKINSLARFPVSWHFIATEINV